MKDNENDIKSITSADVCAWLENEATPDQALGTVNHALLAILHLQGEHLTPEAAQVIQSRLVDGWRLRFEHTTPPLRLSGELVNRDGSERLPLFSAECEIPARH